MKKIFLGILCFFLVFQTSYAQITVNTDVGASLITDTTNYEKRIALGTTTTGLYFYHVATLDVKGIAHTFAYSVIMHAIYDMQAY